jgi:hypothetical protein
MRRIKWVFVTGVIFVLFTPNAQADAATNCRAVARDTQQQLYTVLQANPNDASSVEAIFTKQGIAYPECASELREVFTWDGLGANSGPWPFPQSGDPKTYPLGPISWWWDAIWISLFGKNYILMFLFGWEIFLAPLGIIVPLMFAMFTVVGGTLKGLGKIFLRKNQNPPGGTPE